MIAVVKEIVGDIGLVVLLVGLWRIFKRNRGNKAIACGSITLMVFIVVLAVSEAKFAVWVLPMLALFEANLAVWVLPWLLMLVFWLCLLTLYFFAQQGYRALRRRKRDSNQQVDPTHDIRANRATGP